MEAEGLEIKTLEVDGKTASGGSNPNLLINGNFDIWQRGTSTTSNGYLADRFNFTSYNGFTHTQSRQTFTVGQTDVLNNPTYYHRTICAGTPATDAYGVIFYFVEDVRTMSGETITISFNAKADSNKDIALRPVQLFGSGGSSAVSLDAQQVSLTTSWNTFELTFNLPSISGKTIGTSSSLRFDIAYVANGTYQTVYGITNQSGTFDIAQVKLEEGSVATPFVARPIAEELALCQRYYWQNPATIYGTIYASDSMIFAPFPVTMRTTPTIDVTIRGTVTATYVDMYKVQLKDGDYTETYVLSGDLKVDAEL